MKHCPRCNRTYTDETLLYCLEDGSVLNPAHDPEATQVMPSPRPTDAQPVPAPPTYPSPSYPPQQARSHWPIYMLIALLLLLLGGGAVTLLIFGYARLHDSTANQNQDVVVQNSPSPSPEAQSSPSTSPTPQSRQLVGTWRTSVVENNQSVEITYTFLADGGSKAVFRTRDGRSETHYGSWRYSDATLFETFADGATGKGAIRWIDHDNFEITIVDNGVPLYSGLKRRYRRINVQSE